jgi:hypothetical protein
VEIHPEQYEQGEWWLSSAGVPLEEIGEAELRELLAGLMASGQDMSRFQGLTVEGLRHFVKDYGATYWTNTTGEERETGLYSIDQAFREWDVEILAKYAQASPPSQGSAFAPTQY